MSKITLTFEVDGSNQALLLMTAFDAITRADPDGSMVLQDNFGWLVEDLHFCVGLVALAQLQMDGEIDSVLTPLITEESVGTETYKKIQWWQQKAHTKS